MKIYVKVQENRSGRQAWLYHDKYINYLTDGFEDPSHSYIMPRPFENAKDAIRGMKEAKHLMECDDADGSVKASCWRFVRGRLTETKFTKDGRIKRTAR